MPDAKNADRDQQNTTTDKKGSYGGKMKKTKEQSSGSTSHEELGGV